MSEDLMHRVFGYIRHIENALIPPETDEDHEDGRYPFIPFPPREFSNWALRANDLFVHLYGYQLRPLFLDVGSGIGTKVALARYLGIQSHGIEMNPRYMRVAQRKLRIESSRLFEIDARKFTDYGNYQIIYFYCPMKNQKAQINLEKVIYDGAKEGTIFIQVLKMNHEREKESLYCGSFADLYSSKHPTKIFLRRLEPSSRNE